MILASRIRSHVLRATTLDELVMAACAVDALPLAYDDARSLCDLILDKAAPIIARDRERDAAVAS